MVNDAKMVQFTGPGFEHIQPREAAAANDMNIKLNLKSRSQIIRESGNEPEEVFKELAEENERLEALGLMSMPDDGGGDSDMGDPDEADAKENGNKTASPLADRATRDRIRAEHEAGASYTELAQRYNITRTPITEMLQGRTYKEDRVA